MERDIYFLIDSSGSFNECGKNYLQIYLIDSIVNAISDGTLPADNKFSYFLWNNRINEYTPYDLIKFEGKSNFDVLSDFLMNLDNNSLVFFLSDGNFNGDTIILSQELKEKNIMLLPFAVGADSDVSNLEMLSTTMKIYQTENIVSTISRILLECA